MIRQYAGKTDDSYSLYQIINQSNNRYHHGIHELFKLVKAQGLANVMNDKQKNFLMEDTAGRSGYMIVYFVEANGKIRARIYMYTLEVLFTRAMLDHLFTEKNIDEVDLHVDKKMTPF